MTSCLRVSSVLRRDEHGFDDGVEADADVAVTAAAEAGPPPGVVGECSRSKWSCGK